jgi:hypothetical protein
MKIKPLLIFLCFLTPVRFVVAQTSMPKNILIDGKVAEKGTHLPLAYVNVGILNKPKGTVTDTSGYFSFAIDHENFSDTLQVSIIGYNTLRIPVSDFLISSNKLIVLTVKVEQLAEVTVTNTAIRTNTEIIGRQAVSKLVQVSVHNKKSADETIGSEMGMRYKTGRRNAILKNFNFYVSANNFNYIKFRVNVYSLKKDVPNTLLYNKQIFATVDNFKTGWTKIDLEKYNIKVDGEFIVAIQWIESKMDKKENPVTLLPVAVTPFSKNCYVRIASQDKWKKMGVNLSNFVTIAY